MMRKDSKGYVLQSGETERNDGRYMYTYRTSYGKRKNLYAKTLKALREKEKEVIRDKMDGIKVYAKGKGTLNDAFDRYLPLKKNLRATTRSGYIYMYDSFVRDGFGERKIADINYSDVLRFYEDLITEKNLALATVENIHCILHPTFQMAVRDCVIRINPTDGAINELSKSMGCRRTIRHPLTIAQQRAFLDYIANSPVYVHWWPLFTIFLGTGVRVGEGMALRWSDIDYKNNNISINHSLVYYSSADDHKCTYAIHKPKTEAGIRLIPLLDQVKDALEILKDREQETGPNEQVIDGYSGFIFQDRFGHVPNPRGINKTIKRISADYNANELLAAAKEDREPLLLPDFSCHHLRHTFATRLCENISNLKVIQSIMGHKDITTTMNIYAEATENSKQEAMETLSVKLNNLF